MPAETDPCHGQHAVAGKVMARRRASKSPGCPMRVVYALGLRKATVPKTHIILHHSLTKDGETVSWAAIEKYHRETNGWRDIGYHAGVELVTGNADLVGYAFQGLVGRPPSAVAAACPQGNMNVLGLHLCFVGNFDLAPPSDEILRRAALRFILPWMSEHGIDVERIKGHRDFNPAKSCPGRLFDIDRVRRMVS